MSRPIEKWGDGYLVDGKPAGQTFEAAKITAAVNVGRVANEYTLIDENGDVVFTTDSRMALAGEVRRIARNGE